LLHANGQTHGQTDGKTDMTKTDMTKLILAFRNFANARNENKTVNKKLFLYTAPLYNADCEIG
jgi:hypothetical protein